MRATLSQLHRETRRIVRPVIHGGDEVVITDFGKPAGPHRALHADCHREPFAGQGKRNIG